MAFSYGASNDKAYYLHKYKGANYYWCRAIIKDDAMVGNEMEYARIIEWQNQLEQILKQDKDLFELKLED